MLDAYSFPTGVLQVHLKNDKTMLHRYKFWHVGYKTQVTGCGSLSCDGKSFSFNL